MMMVVVMWEVQKYIRESKTSTDFSLGFIV